MSFMSYITKIFNNELSQFATARFIRNYESLFFNFAIGALCDYNLRQALKSMFAATMLEE